MVKNREELIQVASNNANQMKTHLRNAVRNFLDVQHVSVDELAYVLGITTNELAQILEGDGNVTIDTLSKLLVATDLVVEVKPIRNTPLRGYGRNMPRSGGYPSGVPGGIPVGPDGRPLPPPPGFPPFPGAPTPHRDDRQEIPMETREPQRDSRGRFVKKGNVRQTTAHRPATDANPYAGMPDVELINIIRQNIWDGEINTETATHQQLAEFVANKERIMRDRQNATEQPQPQQPAAPQAEAPRVNGGGDSLNQFLGMLANIAQEAKKNPQLMETISRFMPK